MRILIQNALIYNGDTRSFFEGALLLGLTENSLMPDGRIIEVLPQSRHSFAHLPASDMRIDAGGCHIIPGFVDVHTHGRVCEDFNFSDEAGMRHAAHSYALAGTTSLFPTLASAPLPELCRAAALIRSLKGEGGGACFLGVHLEGRYLNPKRRGAHNPEYLAPLRPDELDGFVNSSGLPVHITAALELDNAGFADRAVALGATLGLGHTDATYAEAIGAWDKYRVSFTHLYNAMPQIHHREGGAAAAALMSGGYCELICDGMHVAPHMVDLTLRNVGIDRLVLVSDSMAAAGAPDGEYTIAGTPAVVRDGIARTPEGALAGSTLDLRSAVENLARFGNIPIASAVLAATENPAAEVGLEGEVGRIAPGARADLLLCCVDETEKKIDISRVFVGGTEVM